MSIIKKILGISNKLPSSREAVESHVFVLTKTYHYGKVTYTLNTKDQLLTDYTHPDLSEISPLEYLTKYQFRFIGDEVQLKAIESFSRDYGGANIFYTIRDGVVMESDILKKYENSDDSEFFLKMANEAWRWTTLPPLHLKYFILKNFFKNEDKLIHIARKDLETLKKKVRAWHQISVETGWDIKEDEDCIDIGLPKECLEKMAKVDEEDLTKRELLMDSISKPYMDTLKNHDLYRKHELSINELTSLKSRIKEIEEILA